MKFSISTVSQLFFAAVLSATPVSATHCMSFYFWNADTDQPLFELKEGQNIPLSDFEFSVEARPDATTGLCPDEISKIEFDMTGAIHYDKRERAYPYFSFGDYSGCAPGCPNPDFTTNVRGLDQVEGSYTLTAKLYDGRGHLVETKTINYTIGAGGGQVCFTSGQELINAVLDLPRSLDVYGPFEAWCISELFPEDIDYLKEIGQELLTLLKKETSAAKCTDLCTKLCEDIKTIELPVEIPFI